MERCTHCGAKRITYHSCRNRHCPTCQQIPRERWLEARRKELLPTTYFHIVFTLPHELNPVILNNKSVMLNCLFKAVSKSLLKFGQNELGAKLGFIAVLHTWDQLLKDHFHLHCLLVGGAVSPDENRWIPCNDYLFNQDALSLVFRGKFMDLMTRACRSGKLKFNGQYQQLKNKLYTKKWVVSVRDPIRNPHHVLEYIARYTHRVAIANSHLLSLKDGMVTFKYKDRKTTPLRKPPSLPLSLSEDFYSTHCPKASSESGIMALWPTKTARSICPVSGVCSNCRLNPIRYPHRLKK
jgi:hypothetical protein